MQAKLVLENGVVFTGEAFGAADRQTTGEVVFNTSMTGYQEILTDPSYAGQIVTMTSPLIGNYGIIGIQGIDTRKLTKILRTSGAMRGVISTVDLDDARLLATAKASPDMNGLDLAKVVTTGSTYTWDAVDRTPFALRPNARVKLNGKRWNVVVYDYGVKQNILRRLTSYGCSLTVVPAAFPAADVLAMNPDGIFLSNGPGDPA